MKEFEAWSRTLFQKDKKLLIQNKTLKPKENFTNNGGHNILKRFDDLSNFHFAASETQGVFVSNKKGIFKFPHKLLHDLRLRILGS